MALSGGNSDVTCELHRLGDQWASTRLTWQTRPEPLEMESRTPVTHEGPADWDITRFVKACIQDEEWNTEVYGLSATAKGDAFRAFASSDNTFYPPYVRIDFDEAPWTLEVIDQINPDQ